ncbi:MAG: recombination protein O N-terminal domain-containing protein [Acidobacteria bacterium]|nr:recombination protein O N-terminal domain-containing protein [Acidobacteriota bacterium]MDW7983186.1 recombination protein O N-terminal domain-containing protein [Acidobacteriota bacterium]
MRRPRTLSVRPRAFAREPAVVLSRQPGPRTSHWVWFYGEQSGLLEVLAEAVRRSRRAVAGTLEPLSVGWLTYRATRDASTHRLVSFDLTWSPYMALQAAGRSIEPATLVFVSLVAETALTLLPGHAGDAYVFDRLVEVSRLMAQDVPYRALAIGWLWTLLVRLGDLSLEGTCATCGRVAGGLEGPDAVWDIQGHLWHPACGPSPEAYRFTTSAVLRRELARLQAGGLIRLGRYPEVARALARRRDLWEFFVRRTEGLVGRPLRSLATAAHLRRDPSEADERAGMRREE